MLVRYHFIIYLYLQKCERAPNTKKAQTKVATKPTELEIHLDSQDHEDEGEESDEETMTRKRPLDPSEQPDTPSAKKQRMYQIKQ